jgi:electron transfer flavoprotein-quinone oxidoreductase
MGGGGGRTGSSHHPGDVGLRLPLSWVRMTEKVDAVIVGAGLAGLGAAYHLAAAGAEVLVVERGDYPGSKNVTGGRLYLRPVRPYYPDLLAGGDENTPPFERVVVKERLAVLADTGGASLEFRGPSNPEGQPHSVTILRGVFDRWLADRATERGALVVSGYKVDDVIRESGRVAGVVAGGDEVRADVVIAADGALSFIAERVGLRPRHDPAHFALGIKEVIELPAEQIEDRFGLVDGEGLAALFFGTITHGIPGGGFLYTNRQSLSVGVVIGMGAMVERGPGVEASELLNEFLARPEVAPLVSAGSVAEYSAHAIPESSNLAMPRLVTDGLVVVGDAAGLALNMGLSVRGMDFALASGALAAQAVLQAKEEGDFSARSLARYEAALRASFVLKDQVTFAGMQTFLENPHLYELYPNTLLKLLESLFTVDEGAKTALWRSAMNVLREIPLSRALVDVWRMRKL